MKDGGPAFPQHGFDPVAERFTSQGGMTLRDWFATHATEEDICSAMEHIPKVETVRDLGNGRKVIDRGYPRNIRQMARYIHADAMIQERSKT